MNGARNAGAFIPQNRFTTGYAWGVQRMASSRIKGGFDLGFERAGMRCIGQVEIDKKCLAWLNFYWPHVKKVEDIHNVKRSSFEAARVICGGFPCQPHSTAGKMLRSKDDRFLWPEMLRVLDEFKTECEFFIAENVSAIDDKHEMVLDRTIFDLENIGYRFVFVSTTWPIGPVENMKFSW